MIEQTGASREEPALKTVGGVENTVLKNSPTEFKS